MRISLEKYMEKPYEVRCVEKEACCLFFDKYIEPRVSEEEAKRIETEAALSEFLKRMNVGFDEFMDYIHFHSLGHGLDYLQEIYEVSSFRENSDDNDSDDNYMDF